MAWLLNFSKNLVDSYNKSFDKGILTNSQRQAVKTLAKTRERPPFVTKLETYFSFEFRFQNTDKR